MKTIREDVKGFFENGGWSFLEAGSDEDQGSGEEGDGEFKADEDDDESADEDEDVCVFDLIDLSLIWF